MAFIGTYTRNKQEMHDLKCILVAWYTFGGRKQKIPMDSFFSIKLKTIRRYFINNKLR